MSAKLEWKRHVFGGTLFLGGFAVGEVWRESRADGSRAFVWSTASEPPVEGESAQVDSAVEECERQVRVLLRAAGVEVS